ncbi:DNA topoisomerase VI subunit B [Candidatus Woesearchaeota archaeon]|nr:DNA topoisomerase VI subunit B [Candidatus Woesearchaeota archaeon]
MAKVVAEKLATKHKEVSVAEFFERNRHLLGFDNKRKALLTVVKEAVDNAIDACEEAKTMPEVKVDIIEMSEDRFRVIVEDNGPGIVKKQIPNIFAKLLYGSKFHTMKQSRGQQGIGISAAVLYSQLTTGRPAKIVSKISKTHEAHYYELHIDTRTNKPEIVKEEAIKWKKDRGTKIELDIEASYQKGDQSVDSYIRSTAIVNPHVTIVYTNPKAEQFVMARVADNLPREAKAIKPHPYGVELGILLKMVRNSDSRSAQSFLTNEFSRVGPGTAKEILFKSGIKPATKPRDLALPHVEAMMKAIKDTKIIAPPTDCIVPIGRELLERGLKKEVNAEFYSSVSRSPQVYRGIPFVVEAGIAYGGEQPADKSAKLLRFANRVPLLFQQSSGASFKSVVQTNWRSYGMNQSGGSLPQGPITIVVHLASVWPPFTSEAKEALAHYPEIIKEMKLALQEAGRQVGIYVNKQKRAKQEQERVNIFENYIPEVAASLSRITGKNKEGIVKNMRTMLKKSKEFIEANKKTLKGETDE